MPKSRKRKIERKKNGLPYSKDARQKLRRWSFVAKITKDGETRAFVPPAITIGDSQAAQAAAADIRKNIAELPQFAEAVVEVEVEAHETVSQAVMSQIHGFEDQNRLLTLALKAAVTDVVSTDMQATFVEPEAFDKAVTERLGKYVIDTQKKLRAQDLAAQGIDPETLAEEQLAVPEAFAVQSVAPAAEAV